MNGSQADKTADDGRGKVQPLKEGQNGTERFSDDEKQGKMAQKDITAVMNVLSLRCDFKQTGRFPAGKA